MEKLFQRLTELMYSQRLYTNPRLSRKQVADALNTNESYLHQSIRLVAGLTFTEYIYNLRLEHACKRLVEADNHSTVEIIAVEAGYYSRKTFHQHFKQKYGCTPAEYRQKNKRTNNHTEAL